MDLLSQVPLLSTDKETKGFDYEAGNRWIYPENLPIRKYQYTIVKTALFNNTLVCLPTGLGKTFIAAVVMYNYFRWYPNGIIVFLAPTKPLVSQQIDACHDIMGIPISDTIELTGATNQKKRYTAWREHRVIFATPQTFQKDLEHSIVPTNLIKCIVIDEAHKALGKHSYSESIRMMHQANPYFRLLALSATPGAKLEAVQDVIRNLHITHLELRDDTSPDITPYINERKLDIILVDLGQDLSQFKERYIEIMDRHVKILLQYNVLRTSTAHISKGRIFHILNEFKSRLNKPINHGIIMKTLNILLTMYHAYELIIRHGLRAFVHFYQNHSDKFWLDNEPELQELLENIKNYLGPFPEVKPLMDGSVSEIPKNLVFGHGKFETLRSILIQHFRRAENKENSTRAIVFTEYRDIVNEVYVLLLQSRPLIRPQVFVGQAGLKQKQQKKALEDFRSNNVNVLISTSVGEEGLDVGEVDLIVCFDISQHSPTRLVQRMGRTGRKRNGHIIVLVTDGKEHQTLQAALAKRDSLNNKVLHSNGVMSALHNSSPRMIPENIQPEVQKIHMTVLPKGPPEKKGRKKKIPLESEKKTKRGPKSKNQKIPEDSGKKSGQGGSLMRFLTTAADEIDNDIVAPKMQDTRFSQNHGSQPLRTNSISLGAIKQADVKLLTNDNETIDFLTLCATRQSEKDDNNNGNKENRNLVIHYAPEVCNCDDDFLNNLTIPDESILNCLRNVEMFVKPVENVITQATPGVIISGREGNYYSEENFMNWENNFEDLLDTSESDVDSGCGNRESPPLESVDWSNNHSINHNGSVDRNLGVNFVFKSDFENLLNDSSAEEIQPSPEIITKMPKSQFENRKTQEKNRSLECIAESAFENILDELSDEDLDETQFSFDSNTINTENHRVKIKGNESQRNLHEEKVDRTLGDTKTMDMEVEMPVNAQEKNTPMMIEKIPCSSALVEIEDIGILSQFSYHSTERKSRVNGGNSLDGKTEGINNEETAIELMINDGVNTESQDQTHPLARGNGSGINSHAESNPFIAENNIGVNSHSIVNSTPSRNEDKPQKYNEEINLIDLDDDFEFEEDMRKIETMPQASMHSETFIPQPSTSHTNIANQRNVSISRIHYSWNHKGLMNEVNSSPCKDPSNYNTSSKNLMNFDVNQGEEFHSVSTKKEIKQRTIFNKLLNLSKTSKKPSEESKSTNSFKLTAPSSLSVEPGAEKKTDKIFEDDSYDFDWGSDFETPPEAIITESRFFKENTKPSSVKADRLIKIAEYTGSSGEFSSSKCTTKPQNKFQNKPQQNPPLKDDKLRSIRETLFSKPGTRFVTQQDSDSDDDFSSTKIQKTIFNGFASKLNNKTIKIDDKIPKINNKKPPKIVNTIERRADRVPAVNNFVVPKNLPQKIGKRVNSQPSGSSERRRKPMGSRRDRVKSAFIDDEAEESEDCHTVTDSSAEDDGEELVDFVSHTQVQDDSVDMKAIYLQSTRSPKKRTGFHLKRPKTPPPDLQIFSQAVEPDTYLYDSFCVRESQEEDEVLDDSSPEEITILEEIDNRSSKKRKRRNSVDSRSKRKRIQTVEDNSSDDETESLRTAILEESMMLKKRR